MLSHDVIGSVTHPFLQHPYPFSGGSAGTLHALPHRSRHADPIPTRRPRMDPFLLFAAALLVLALLGFTGFVAALRGVAWVVLVIAVVVAVLGIIF